MNIATSILGSARRAWLLLSVAALCSASQAFTGPWMAAALAAIVFSYVLLTQIQEDLITALKKYVSELEGGPISFMAEMAEPNARLIAAAPELLEALESLVDAIGFSEGPDGRKSYGIKPQSFPLAFRAARTAIRKARGE